MMSNSSFDTALEAVGSFANAVRAGSVNSLPEFTKSTRVEPDVLIERSLRQQPYISNLMKAHVSIFCGYYMQAASLLTSRVGNISTVRVLDQLNNRRSVKGAAINALDMYRVEAYAEGFPDYSMEAIKPETTSSGFGRSTIEKAYDDSELSVGKLFELNIEQDGHRASIPVAIRLMVSNMAADGLASLLSHTGKDRSASSRMHEWRAGGLKFWRDLVMCQDIIEDHRKILKTDRSGKFSEQIQARAKNRLAGILTLAPTVNNISSIAIISDDTRRTIERNIRGKLNRFSTRNQMMEDMGLMILTIVDTETDMVTMYHHGISGATELTVSEMKSMSRKEPDVTEILRTFAESKAPNF